MTDKIFVFFNILMYNSNSQRIICLYVNVCVHCLIFFVDLGVTLRFLAGDLALSVEVAAFVLLLLSTSDPKFILAVYLAFLLLPRAVVLEAVEVLAVRSDTSTGLSIPILELIPNIRTLCIAGIFAMMQMTNIPTLTNTYIFL